MLKVTKLKSLHIESFINSYLGSVKIGQFGNKIANLHRKIADLVIK